MEEAPKGLDSRVGRYDQGTALPTMSASDSFLAQEEGIVKQNHFAESEVEEAYYSADDDGLS